MAVMLLWAGSTSSFSQDGYTTPQDVAPVRPQLSSPAQKPLTTIAECLANARNKSNALTPLKIAATVTLMDEARGLVVLQDDTAAMAIHTPLAGLALRPGKHVIVEGSGVLPYVRAFPDYPDQPSARSILKSFEIPSGRGSYYLTRVRGYLRPPVSGKYTFWIAADDAGEFWISADASPERMQKIAENQIGNAAGLRDWDRFASQRSQPVMLKAGEAYYVEALHVQAITRDCLAVAWAGPGIERSVIAGRYLTPWIESPTGGRQTQSAVVSTNGLLWECWTNFFVRDYEALHSASPEGAIVPIRSLKLTLTGADGLPQPQQINADTPLQTVPNMQWVELEGDVNFVAGTAGKLQLELKCEEAVLGVRVLNWQGLSTDRLRGSSVRIRGVLEHASGPKGELISSVLWVPDDQQISLLPPASSPEDLNRVSICEITPSNPEMSWGRRVSVRGKIIDRTTNGLVVVAGNDNYQGFCSVDGTNWISLGKPVEVEMSNAIPVGLAVVSGHATEPITASFSHLEGWGTNWSGAEIGGPKQTGSFSVRDGILTVKGSGRKMGERGDQLYFLSQPLPGESARSVRLADLVAPNLRPQTGLMARESLDNGSPFAAVLFAPANGPVFQYRRTLGNSINGFEARPAHRQFRWLKLVKRKSLLIVSGEPGPELGTNQEVKVTGMVTWQNNTPILAGAFFEPAQIDNRLSRTVVSELPQSIASFLDRVLHPPEPYLLGRMNSLPLQGIVTFCGDFQGQSIMFAQSGNESGIQMGWSDAKAHPKFTVGQLVELRGNATVRKFPVVLEPIDLKAIGWGTLPKPVQYSAALVKNSNAQACWTEATGVGRTVDTNGLINLKTKDGILPVWVGQTDAKEYVDDLIRVRGVLAMDSNRTAQLLVPSPGFVEVLERAPVDPFAIPCFSIAQLAGLEVKPERLRRMKSAGVVTCQLPQGIFFQDDTGGAFVQTSEARVLRPGDRIEVVGFPNKESATLILSSPVIRKISTANPAPPTHISAAQFIESKFAGMLVSLDALLLEQRDTPDAQLLTLQVGTKIFEAARPADEAGRLPQIPPGSHLTITGVCQIGQGVTRFGMTESEAARAMSSLTIWIPTPANVLILARPPWWTVKRAAWAGGLFAGGLLGALIWVRVLRRRVAQKNRELQITMNQLAKETQTSAVLGERDRLAGEIHDSLQQGLAAIILQLDVANKHADDSPEARRLLRMARRMAEFSRAEVEHAVWDLQSPLLHNADLGTALTHVASLISTGSPQVTVAVRGQAQPLPSAIEHHLLRIGQEAITNAIKHAQAQSVHLSLSYADTEIQLSAQDDGIGFIPETVLKGNGTGHFGLHGIRARARKIGARFLISSQPGKGTNITVTLALPLETIPPQTNHKNSTPP